MVVYSIKDLEKLSGVKAHTLRIWEKRYGIINPKRTNTNIRYYLDEDLKHVLNIALLNKNGLKISKIAEMPDEEIIHRVAQLSEVNKEFENQLDSLTLSLLGLDEYKFNKILNANFEQLGFRETMMTVVYPLLNKLSVMWVTGSINGAQEHFVRYLIRQKTIAAIDKIPSVKNSNTPLFLIYLPENENHELSLLFMHFLLKEAGFRVVNLGLDINIYNLSDAYDIAHPNYIFTIINDSFIDKPLQFYVDHLLKRMEGSKIILSGLQVTQQTLRSHIDLNILASFPDIIKFLDTLKQEFPL